MADVILQVITHTDYLPSQDELQKWINLALPSDQQYHAITIRVVDRAESQALNTKYRHETKPTNILSFPFDAPEGFQSDLLGDLVVCPSIIEAEASSQHKSLTAHWAHLIIHGTLHLLGFNHLNGKDAAIMEAKEIELLTKLNFPNPY